ncbi:hypothetical protein [Amaricoccus sp.]|uniref:hypothetical protein n=1 Tax=Amaricoccus sp. TaxID=1872485 RepID=UPI003FA60DA7
MLERRNEAAKCRIHAVRILPKAGSCRRLVRALAVETRTGRNSGGHRHSQGSALLAQAGGLAVFSQPATRVGKAETVPRPM